MRSLERFLNWIWQQLLSALSAVLSPVAGAFKAAISGWTALLYVASNNTLAAYEGNDVSSNPAVAESDTGEFLAPIFIGAGLVVVVIEVLLGLAAPFDIGAATLIGFALPLLLKALGGVIDGTGVASWPGMILGELTKGTVLTVEGFGSLVQWLLNETAGSSVASATGKVAPSVPGDFAALVAVVLAGTSIFAGLWAWFSYYSGLSTPVQGLPVAQQADAASNAACSLPFGIAAMFLGVFEYAVSLGAQSLVSYVAQMMLAVLTGFCGGFAIAYGALAVYDEGIADTPLVAFLGEGFGMASTGWSIWDIWTQLGSGPQ